MLSTVEVVGGWEGVGVGGCGGGAYCVIGRI